MSRMVQMDRRELLKNAALLGTLAAFGGCASRENRIPGRGGTMADFALKPMDEVRFGFVGLNRGSAGVRPMALLPGMRVTALCDLRREAIDRCQGILEKCGVPPAREYTGSEDAWKKMADDPDVDFVIIGTPWLLHTPMALYFMEHGKHVGVEVPAAVNIEECWRLVETSERTRCVCMQLENRCYNEIEMMMANAIAEGTIGEVMYAECGYIHEIRDVLMPCLNGDGTYRPFSEATEMMPVSNLKLGLSWRGQYDKEHCGNPYPTHGIGPIAQILGVNRGDRFDYLVSVDSGSAALKAYAERMYGKGSREAENAVLKMGDRNVSLIRTVNGRLIALSHNVVTPRPGSRLSLVEGTKGAFSVQGGQLATMRPDDALFPFRYTLETAPVHRSDAWLPADEGRRFAEAHAHPLWRDAKDLAKLLGGHGGQDFMMFLRLAYCLRKGLPVDQDVYDLATWSSIVELSERSAASRGRSMDFPDFTDGAWRRRRPLEIGGIDAEYLAEMRARAGRLRTIPPLNDSKGA